MRFLLFALFFCALVLHGQTPLGTVSGLAVDASGGAVAAASVTLTNNDTGVRRTAATNAAGAYAFPDLPPGTYRLRADAKGFRPIETRAFPVEAYRTRAPGPEIRSRLQPPPKSSSPMPPPPSCNSNRPRWAARSRRARSSRLPTNLRSVSKNSGDSGLISSILPLTVPGVVQVGNGAKWLTPGAGAASVKVKVDGIETTFGNFGSPDNVSQPSVEAIQEFTANLLTTRAEFGGMGTITTATKSRRQRAITAASSGTCATAALDARNAFATVKPFQNLHNYGGTHRRAHPQRQDVLLFRFRRPARRRRYALHAATCRPLAMRQGDFSGLRRAPQSLHRQSIRSSGTPSPRRSSVRRRLRSQELFFPLPNFGAANLTAANYRASFNGPEVHRTEEIKLDHNFSDAPPRLPALRESQGRLRYPRRALPAAADHRRHVLQSSAASTSGPLGDVVAMRPEPAQ